jgi:O-acetylserine/cysteine efflux transporter
VVLIWGLNFVVIEAGLADIPPLLFLAIRFMVVCIPAVFFIKPPGIGFRRVVLIGAFLSLGQFAGLYISLALGMPPGLASLLVQSQVVLTVLVAVVLLKERPSRKQIVGIVIGMVGLSVVVIGHSQVAPLLPLVVCLLGALSWAIGNVLARQAKAASGLSLTIWSGLVVPIPAFLLSLAVDGPVAIGEALAGFDWVAVLSTLYTAGLASLVGYGIWNSLLARYPTSAVVPFTLLVPIIGILTAWLVKAELPTATETIGGAIMLGGLAAATLSRRTKPPIMD